MQVNKSLVIGLAMLFSQERPLNFAANSYYADATNSSACPCTAPAINPDLTCGALNNPYSCIPDAVGRTAPGDLVVVQAGSYPECFDVTRSGNPGSRITIQGPTDRSAIISRSPLNATCSARSYAVGLSASHVTFKGFRVTGAPTGQGIKVASGFTSIEISNVESHDNRFGITIASSGTAVRDSLVRANTDKGVDVTAPNVELTRLEAHNNIWGIRLEPVADNTSLNDLFVHQSFEYGIVVESNFNTFNNLISFQNLDSGLSIIGSDNVVTGGTISYNTLGINLGRFGQVTSTAHRNRISAVEIHHNAPHPGVKIYSGEDNLIENSHIHHNGMGVVESAPAIRSVIRGCEINDNGRALRWDHGLYLNGSDGLIQGNRIHHNTAYGIKLGANPRRTIVERNDIYGNGDIMIIPVPSCPPEPPGIPSTILRVEGGGITITGSPAEATPPGNGLPQDLVVRYNTIHHNVGSGLAFFLNSCTNPASGNLVHHNTFYANKQRQIYVGNSAAGKLLFKNNIVIGEDPTKELVVTEFVSMAPNELDGNLYYRVGATADTDVFKWNFMLYSFNDLKAPNAVVGQKTACDEVPVTCSASKPCPQGLTCFQNRCYDNFVAMETHSQWSSDVRFVDLSMAAWDLPPPGRRGNFHLRVGSAGRSGGVCCPEMSGGFDMDGESVPPCGLEDCSSLATGIGADFYLDTDGDGTADRFDCSPGSTADARVCDGDPVPEAQEAVCVANGYAGAPYDPAVYPGAVELCDLHDNNCDLVYHAAGEADADSDGFALCSSDCNDADPRVYSGAQQHCDGRDNDCLPPDYPNSVPLDEVDVDQDAFWACRDCNDNECAITLAGQTDEVQDGADNDCDGLVDEGVTDADSDGWMNDSGDCNDSNALIYPAAAELCDGVDQDCDSVRDDGFPDGDQDGWASCGGDCNDANASTNPGASEVCNGADDNCLNGIDEGYPDDDSDGAKNCVDNCPSVANPSQSDEDSDGIGDACEAIEVFSEQVTAGTLVAGGSLTNLRSTSPDDSTRNSYDESGSPKSLTVLWTFNPSTATTSLPYDLVLEGAHDSQPAGGNELHFPFSYATLATSGAQCNSVASGNWSPVVLTAEKRIENDGVQKARICPAGAPASSCPSAAVAVFCIRVQDDDQQGSDNKTDRLTLDRLYLIPAATPPAEVVAAAGGVTGDVGGTVTNTFVATIASGDVRESIKERTSSPNLIRTWRFDHIPPGSFHRLHIEGYETNLDADSFQFYYAWDVSSGYAAITGAIISTASENSAGADYTFGGATTSPRSVYIQARDIGSGTKADTLHIDQLSVKTVP